MRLSVKSLGRGLLPVLLLVSATRCVLPGYTLDAEADGSGGLAGGEGVGGNEVGGSGGVGTGGGTSSGGVSSGGGTGGEGDGGAGGTGGDGAGGSSGGGGSGGAGSGGAPPTEPPFTASDCTSAGGPSQTVLDSGIGAFTSASDWMAGWTNWSTNSTPEDADPTAGGGPYDWTVSIDVDIAVDMTLSADEVYEIVDVVHVLDGATLTIPAGTLFKSTGTGTLIVSRGGRLVAQGTAQDPIVFTSQANNGYKAAGQWGGIVLLGNASNNTGTDVTIEGFEAEPLEQHGPGSGGPNETQDSGILEYVRIEFAGAELGDEIEINGLTLGSVGSGTSIGYVQVNTSRDDAFDINGGRFVGHHLVANNVGDDAFDIDQGYTGNLDILFGRQGVTVKADPNGFEWDSSEEDSLPATHPLVSHVTLCGVAEGKPNYGMVLREHVEATVTDVAFTGFDFGIDLRDAVSGDLSITGSYSWGHAGGLENVAGEASADPSIADDQVEAAWFVGQTGNVDWDQ